MILFLDTSADNARIALVGSQVWEFEFVDRRLSETLLPQIAKFLKKKKINLKQIKKLAVVTGPGPFSRLRTGVVAANTLAFALDLPVAGLKKSQLPADLKKLNRVSFQQQVLPFYERAANITKPKK